MSPRSRTEAKHLRVYEAKRHRTPPVRVEALALSTFVWVLAWSIGYILGLPFVTWRALIGLLVGVHLYYLVPFFRRNQPGRR